MLVDKAHQRTNLIPPVAQTQSNNRTIEQSTATHATGHVQSDYERA